MTSQRAREIVRLARLATQGRQVVWEEILDEVFESGEREEINRVWANMPDHTSFIDALRKIAEGK